MKFFRSVLPVMAVLALLVSGCNSGGNVKTVDPKPTVIPNNAQTPSATEPRVAIFGKWKLDKIALKSDAYDGTSSEAGEKNEEHYLGKELEYTDKYLRLGEKMFLNPKYTLEYMKISEYDDGGKFRLPDFYGYILNEKINIENKENYKDLSDVPLKFFNVTFDKDYFIQVGTQVVMLDKDTMLVGIWGKIILAHRVKM